jgi:hypothetical protein
MDIYWLNNRNVEATEAEISFRVTGKVPRLWHPKTGKIENVSYQIKDGRTIVPLKFESWDAYFVVFKDKTTVTAYTKPAGPAIKETLTITSPWTVTFEEGRGAPANATFEKLTSWTESNDTGIKYFSGTATYKTTFNSVNGGKGTVDLGDVKNIAEVYLNGKYQGIAWGKPFQIQLADALNKGQNILEIKITNVWVNRLVGDAQPNIAQKITFATMPFYNKDSNLMPSGLLGPVKVMVMP